MLEVYRKPIRMMCEDDARVRIVNVKCYCWDGSFAADTFFSVPASCRVRGKYVHGYVSSNDQVLQFHAHNVCKRLFWLNAA